MHGLSFSDNKAEMMYLDVRDDDPFSHLLSVVSFLETQATVLEALPPAFPEVTNSTWTLRVQVFRQDVQRLWQKLSQRFPDEYKAVQQRIGEAEKNG